MVASFDEQDDFGHLLSARSFYLRPRASSSPLVLSLCVHAYHPLHRSGRGAHGTILERGPFVSFANCGLPCYVGNVIAERAALEVAKPALFHNRFNIDVRTKTEALALDRAAQTVTTSDGVLDYDYLVLAPGAAAVQPEQIPGVDRPGVLPLRTIPDADRIKSWIASQATVVGAGFIGIEMAEMLRLRGLAVTLLDVSPQILPPLDPEMTRPLQDAASSAGVTIRLGEAPERIDDDLTVHTAGGGGDLIPSDLVILCIGVRPESKLASDAGLELGPHGGIMVNERLQTSDPRILAVGDAVEDVDYVMHGRLLKPLAVPANAQGRLAAAVIAGDGRPAGPPCAGEAASFRLQQRPQQSPVAAARAA